MIELRSYINNIDYKLICPSDILTQEDLLRNKERIASAAGTYALFLNRPEIFIATNVFDSKNQSKNITPNGFVKFEIVGLVPLYSRLIPPSSELELLKQYTGYKHAHYTTAIPIEAPNFTPIEDVYKLSSRQSLLWTSYEPLSLIEANVKEFAVKKWNSYSQIPYRQNKPNTPGDKYA